MLAKAIKYIYKIVFEICFSNETKGAKSRQERGKERVQDEKSVYWQC